MDVSRHHPATGSGRILEEPTCDDVAPEQSEAFASEGMDLHGMTQLARTIEHEIIPRLMLAHHEEGGLLANPANGAAPHPTEEDVLELTRLVLRHDPAMAVAYLRGFRDKGVPVESLYLDLLSPSARLLGRMWEEDLCSFTDVTIGVCALQRAIREFGQTHSGVEFVDPGGRRILLLPAPGEQHTFGLFVVEEFFRKSGWTVLGGVQDSPLTVTDLDAYRPFDVLAFSLAGETHVDRLGALIRDARSRLAGDGTSILVGGALVNEQPELVSEVGADAAARDGRDAVAMATLMVEQGARS